MGKLFFYIYRVVISLLIPFIYLRYLAKGRKYHEYRQRLSERFGRVPTTLDQGLIWVHAVSVGEVNAAVPLIEKILESGDKQVMVTCVTPTGSDQIKRSLGDSVDHIYAPIDSKSIVQKIIFATKPQALIIVETEIWPNLIRCCAENNVPVAFVNLRISDKTYVTAKKVKPLCRYVLKDVDEFCVQTAADSQRIIDLGADTEKVHITGNLKFDVQLPSEIKNYAESLRQRWNGNQRPTIILGSSHEGEELGFMQVFKLLREKYPQLVCVIVPRHPQRFDAVVSAVSEFEFNVIRRTEWEADIEPQEVDVIVVDTMGELMSFYAACEIAVVGGSFVPVGGHNILEPILVETPPVFGPNMSNFREVAYLVKTAGAGEQVHNFDELRQVLENYLSDYVAGEIAITKGQKLLASNRGSIQRTLEKINSLFA